MAPAEARSTLSTNTAARSRRVRLQAKSESPISRRRYAERANKKVRDIRTCDQQQNADRGEEDEKGNGFGRLWLLEAE